MKKTVLLLSILIIASFLRLYNLLPPVGGLPPGLYPDEAMNGNNAVEALEVGPLSGGWKVFYQENFGREGLFINIQSLFVGLLGNEAGALRLPSAIFGILTVLGLYLFTKELFTYENTKTYESTKLALLSSFLLATSFWHINFSRIGFRAIMAPFFLVWGLYFLLKSLNANRYTLYAAIAGLTYGLGFHSYIAYRATPLLLLFIMFALYKKSELAFRKNLLKIFGAFALFAFLAGLPLGLYFLENPEDFLGRTTGISVFNSEAPIRDLAFNSAKTLGMLNIFGDLNWRHNIAARPLLFWPVGIFFLVGAYSSLRGLFKEKNPYSGESVLWFWILVAALPVVISNEGLPHALRSMLMIPPIFIISAIGGMRIYDLLKSYLDSRWLSVISYLFIGLLITEAFFSYFVTWGQNPSVKSAFSYNDYVIAKQLNELPKETPKYILVSGADRKIERDYPISLQTVLFITDSFAEEKRREKNLFYLTEEEFALQKIEAESYVIKL